MATVGTVTGRLTKDHETKEAGTRESLVVKFTIASQSNRKNKEGEYGANFVPVEMWMKPTDGRLKHLIKGTYVILGGSWNEQKWVDKETQEPRSRWVFNAYDFEFGPNPKPQSGNGSSEVAEADPDTDSIPDPTPDNIPF